MKKVFLLIGLGVVVAVVLLIGRKGQGSQKFSLAKVKRTDLSQTVSASGKVKAQEQVDLKFQTSGLLAWVGVKEGDYVKKGQAIASLDKKELEKTFQKYANDYLSERADFEQTQGDYKETKERKLVTDTVQRVLDKAQYDLNKAVLDYEIKDLAVKYATIYSPIEGIVTSVDTPIAGVNITPATAVFTVASPGQMVFRANIDEADIGEVRLHQEARVTLDAYAGEEFRGTVDKVGFTAVTTSGGGTAFPVEVNLPANENLKFRVGMNGDVEILVWEKKGVLTVPASAIFRRSGQPYVWKVVEGKAVKQAVTLGAETEERVEITAGLEGQEEIVGKDINKVKEGEVVK